MGWVGRWRMGLISATAGGSTTAIERFGRPRGLRPAAAARPAAGGPFDPLMARRPVAPSLVTLRRFILSLPPELRLQRHA